MKPARFLRSLAEAAIPLLILLLLFQLQRSLGALRYLNPIVRYVFIAGYVVAAVQLLRSRLARSNNFPTTTTSQASKIGFIGIWSSASSLCLLVLMISWSNGGTQDYSATGGVLPWSDAAGYFEGAQRLLYDGHLTGFTERRPLNALFFAARLYLTGNNFFGALVIQALLSALALSLATRVVMRTHGKTAALLFFMLCFSFIGTYIQKTLSESLGITLGLVAFALQWAGLADKRLTEYSIGTFVLALALLARAGAMFVLPASVVFAFLFFSSGWRGRLVAASAPLAAIVGAWLLNLAMIRLYGTNSGGALLSNFSYVIYGLSQGGGGWTKAVTDLHLEGGEAEVAALLYRKAVETILTNPSLLAWGLCKSLALSMATFPIHIFRLIADGSDGSTPSAIGHLVIAGTFIAPPVCFGLFKTLRIQVRRLDDFHLFLLIYLVGFITSLPFFYLDGGIRLTAATFPVTAATIALVCSTLIRLSETKHSTNAPLRSNVTLSYAIAAAIILASLCVPKLNQFTQIKLTHSGKQCGDGEKEIDIRTGDGSAHLNIVSDSFSNTSFAPNIRQSDFIISDVNEKKQEWLSLEAPITVLMGFENKSGMLVEIVGPLGFANGPSKPTSLCAMPLEDGIFSYLVTPK